MPRISVKYFAFFFVLIRSCNSSEPELKKALTRFVPNKRFGDRRSNVVGARTYFYLNEDNCDQNMKIFLNCIDAVSGMLSK